MLDNRNKFLSSKQDETRDKKLCVVRLDKLLPRNGQSVVIFRKLPACLFL